MTYALLADRKPCQQGVFLTSPSFESVLVHPRGRHYDHKHYNNTPRIFPEITASTFSLSGQPLRMVGWDKGRTLSPACKAIRKNDSMAGQRHCGAY